MGYVNRLKYWVLYVVRTQFDYFIQGINLIGIYTLSSYVIYHPG